MSVGCLGHAGAAYKGTILSGDEPGYAFEPSPSPSAGIPGARVRLGVTDPGKHCADLPPLEDYELSKDKRHDHVTSSDAWGRYEVYRTVLGFAGAKNNLLLCVEHPEYERFEYVAIFEDTKDPKHGERFLNVRLKKRAGGH